MYVREDHPTGRTRFAPMAGPEGLELGYGRFLQTDPLGYDDGLNWYDYVKSDPINNYDPTGTDLECSDGRYFTASELTRFGDTPPCVGEVVALGRGGGHGGGGLGVAGLGGNGGAGPGGGGGGVGGGRSAPAPAPVAQKQEPKAKSRVGCLGSALWANKTGLALDALGWIANAAVPEASAGAAIAGSVLGIAGIAGAVADNNGPVDGAVSGVIAYTGKQAAVANGLMRGAGSVIAGRIGFAALALSSSYDLAKTGAKYRSCINGAK